MLKSFYKENCTEAGIDEAGRGCLAGPVVAAAVILPVDYCNPLLDDSKKLSAKQREILRQEIMSIALSYSVSFIDNKTIDKLNILNATYLAMNSAVKTLDKQPEHLIIDGNRFKNQTDIQYTCIVKGDGKYAAIAAASILAKTFRDEFMLKIHETYPVYKWNSNKGYPTKDHVKALRKNGYTVYHRKSFHLKSDQLTLGFNN